MFMVFLSHCSLTKQTIFYNILEPCFLVTFFFLSGYVYKYKGLRKSITSIVNSLLIPYFCFCILLTLCSVTLLKLIISVDVSGINSYFSNALYKTFMGFNFWFIPCLIVVQLAYTLASKYIFLNRNDIRYNVIVCILGILSIFIIRRDTNGSLFFCIDNALYALGWFALGNIAKDTEIVDKIGHSMISSRIFSIILLLCYCLVCLLLDWDKLGIYYDMGNNRYDNPYIQLPLSIFGCIALLLFSMTCLSNKKHFIFFNLLGQHTLAAFCLHGFLGGGILHRLFSLLHIDVLQNYPHIFVLIYCYVLGWMMVGCSILLNKYVPFIVGKRNTILING